MLQKFFSAIAGYGVAVGQWVEAHPVFATVVFWPLVTAILTAVLKPRTPEQYVALAARNPSWFFARWAAFLQLVGATGLDPVKALKILRKFWGGKFEPLPPPSGPSKLPFVVLFVGAGALVTSTTGCTPAMKKLGEDLAVDKTKCAIANLDVPPEEMLRRCLIGASEAPAYEAVAAEARAVSAKQAIFAAARAAHDAHEEECASPR